MTGPVLFETRACRNGMRLGLATLNAPKTLNGLSLEMCELLDERLRAWQDDPDIAVVILQGAGEKAFCAGGDLHGLYASMQANASGDPLADPYATRFFEVEYRLDYLLHNYAKPLLVWGHGIVMGGGIGLMAGASHRVVSETSRLAMPEITIGLFPDVGGSWILRRMPGHCGLFLALTGAHLGASDALFAGLADFRLDHAGWPVFLAGLEELDWVRAAESDGAEPAHAAEAARARNDALLHRALVSAEPERPLEPGPLRHHLYLINNLCGRDSLEEIGEGLRELSGHEDPWLARAGATFAAGAPGSARLAYALQQRTRMMSLAQVFRTEYWAALVCAARGDLKEGIRALLVDKDRNPRWNPASLAEANEAWVEQYFQAPWKDGEHPLADLGD